MTPANLGTQIMTAINDAITLALTPVVTAANALATTVTNHTSTLSGHETRIAALETGAGLTQAQVTVLAQAAVKAELVNIQNFLLKESQAS